MGPPLAPNPGLDLGAYIDEDICLLVTPDGVEVLGAITPQQRQTLLDSLPTTYTSWHSMPFIAWAEFATTTSPLAQPWQLLATQLQLIAPLVRIMVGETHDPRSLSQSAVPSNPLLAKTSLV